MRLSIAPIMLLALACGCGGESGLEKLQGTWVEVPVPRSWYETSVTEEQHRGYLAKFAAREPEILVFKNNTLTSLTGDSVVSRKFEVLEEREASGLRLQFVIEHGVEESASCCFRGGLLEYTHHVWEARDPRTGAQISPRSTQAAYLGVTVSDANEPSANETTEKPKNPVEAIFKAVYGKFGILGVIVLVIVVFAAIKHLK